MHQFTSGFPTKYLCRKLRSGGGGGIFVFRTLWVWDEKKKKDYCSASQTWPLLSHRPVSSEPFYLLCQQALPRPAQFPALDIAQAQAENPDVSVYSSGKESLGPKIHKACPLAFALNFPTTLELIPFKEPPIMRAIFFVIRLLNIQNAKIVFKSTVIFSEVIANSSNYSEDSV